MAIYESVDNSNDPDHEDHYFLYNVLFKQEFITIYPDNIHPLFPNNAKIEMALYFGTFHRDGTIRSELRIITTFPEQKSLMSN